MREGEIDRLAPGKKALHFIVEIFVFVRSPVVADEKESAIEEVFAEGGDFIIGELHAADLLHGDHRITEKGGVGDVDLDRVGIDLDAGELFEAEREIDIGGGPIGSPAIAVAGLVGFAVRAGVEFEADVGEDVRSEMGIDLPGGSAAAIGGEWGDGGIIAAITAESATTETAETTTASTAETAATTTEAPTAKPSAATKATAALGGGERGECAEAEQGGDDAALETQGEDSGAADSRKGRSGDVAVSAAASPAAL